MGIALKEKSSIYYNKQLNLILLYLGYDIYSDELVFESEAYCYRAPTDEATFNYIEYIGELDED